MFITSNRTSFHLWCKENLVKHEKVSKYWKMIGDSENEICDQGLDSILHTALTFLARVVFGIWKYSQQINVSSNIFQ